MFLNADTFRRSCDILLNHHNDRGQMQPGPLLPLWVMQALTCELFLKCTIAITTSDKKPRGHKLHELFDRIPPRYLPMLNRNYAAVSKNDAEHQKFFKTNPKFKDEFRAVLEGGSDVFTLVRYSYEGIGSRELLNCWPVPILALRRTILEIKAAWPFKQL